MRPSRAESKQGRVSRHARSSLPPTAGVYDYVYRTMPFGTPGTLAPGEVYSLVAVLLFMNGIVPEDAVSNAQTLPMVMMPARDRFVGDEWGGGGGGGGGAETR